MKNLDKIDIDLRIRAKWDKTFLETVYILEERKTINLWLFKIYYWKPFSTAGGSEYYNDYNRIKPRLLKEREVYYDRTKKYNKLKDNPFNIK